MANGNFVDYVKIYLRSGNGGAGSAHFYRAKGITHGGPDGGDGGRGGHIILKGNRNLWTLLGFKYRKHTKAEHGQNGSENNRFGAEGKDEILEVPLGTIVRDPETGEVEFEITRHDEERILLPGGRGGLGNTHFKSSTNRTPRYAQPGEEGIEAWKILELKVLADVGLVGLPNVGKSTLLSVVSAAKPEIADYEFTTLVPNLGMVQYRDGRSFVMADIPGIIEGAHEGKGLGHRFLRHIERNATLLFCISADADDIKKQYRILLNELEQYNPELLDKPRVLALTRADLVDEELKRMRQHEIPTDLPHRYISAVTGEGITELKDLLYQLIISQREAYDGQQVAMEEE
ncbi:GTPase ObgE [Neolewinella lacunae]|uniref:GTPase Obg n=1 Tax=Neolewinella lacunae TaxID=1517758 RepID=A0A923PM58_9BACT|nr:GTPase ObgE [Neolewinella lacunae]MBC6994231.1 GTPase ObgE [Neolewinella lacunae]MDN3634610.1 GTPase ObgE [Neolewinella lacunae]